MKGPTREVRAEALHLATNLIRGRIRETGNKVSDYAVKDIRRVAKELLSEPEGGAIWARAEVIVKERERAVQEQADKLLEGRKDLWDKARRNVKTKVKRRAQRKRKRKQRR